MVNLVSGYSKRPLYKKIGDKEKGVGVGGKPPNAEAEKIIEYLDDSITFGEDFEKNTFDLIHIFSKSINEVKQLIGDARISIKQNGMIWLSWPKKTSKVPTDLSDGIIREIGLATELVDIKVAAIDEIWSGLKFVIRKEDRL